MFGCPINVLWYMRPIVPGNSLVATNYAVCRICFLRGLEYAKPTSNPA